MSPKAKANGWRVNATFSLLYWKTSIFVAGKIGGTPASTGIIVGIVLLAIGIFIFARKNKFHFERVIRMKKLCLVIV